MHVRVSHTCGVAEFLLDSLVERRAIVSDLSVWCAGRCRRKYVVRSGETICDLPAEEWNGARLGRVVH